MCTSVTCGDTWITRDQSKIVVDDAPGRLLRATVIESDTFPIGHVVHYQNSMGHVLCDGNDDDEQDKCRTHPLDTAREINRPRSTAADRAAAARAEYAKQVRIRLAKHQRPITVLPTLTPIAQPTPIPVGLLPLMDRLLEPVELVTVPAELVGAR